MENLKIIPLGGVEEIGINCTVFEYKDRMVVIDMGLGFPDANMYGVDYVVPNVEYLEKNKNKIEGLFITHGHLDHIGGLQYLLPRIGFPDIFASEFTIELIRAKLQEFDLDKKVRLHKVKHDSVMQSGEFQVEFFRVNHSIPQCLGIVITTPAGRVVHTGDFKFDNSPVNEPVADYARMAEIGEKGVDLLLSDSTNSLKKGHPISESEVAAGLETIIKNAEGRVVIASFSGLVGRLYQLIKIAEKYKRKVALAGYSMNQTLRIAKEIGYINPKPNVIVPIQKVNKFNDEHVMILTTGAQGESNAALSRMANGDYKRVKIKKSDTVVLSASTIPGNQVPVQELVDSISAIGAEVFQSADMDLFTSGHGYQEDQKIMLNLIKPKNFMPVHGYQYFLRAHANTAKTVGIKESNIIIPKRGSVVEGNKHDGFSITGKVKAFPLLVSGLGVGDVGTAVLSEREQLGNHGVVVIDASIDLDSKKLITTPFVSSKGFVYVKTSKDVILEIGRLAQETLEKQLKKTTNSSELREKIEREVSKYVETETGRKPVILSMLSFIKKDKLK